MNAPDRRSRALRGRRALVTGATGGIGGAIALALGRAGCHLVLSGRDTARLAASVATVRACVGADVEVQAHVADLADPAAAARLAAASTAGARPVDVLVNCAGLFGVGPIADATDEDFARLFGVNVRAPFQLIRALAPGMAERGWGRIVNVGSSSSYAGFADTALYCASKHALLGLSRATQAEYAARGVRSYCVAPGSVRTAMGREVPAQEWDTFLDPGEVAEYVVFVMSFDDALVSDEIRLHRITRLT